MPLEKRAIIQEPSSGLWKNGENPDVYVDIFGITHIVWAGVSDSGIKRIFYVFDDGNLIFNETNVIAIGHINRNSDHPKIAVNKSRRVSIVFEVENQNNDGIDIFLANNDGSFDLSWAVDISRNSGTGLFNTQPQIVLNDIEKSPHFIWIGTHPTTKKLLPYYTRKHATTLIPTTHIITPDINHDCSHTDIELMGDLDEIFVCFEQIDATTHKRNIKLAQGDESGFNLIGFFTDSSSNKIVNRPTLDEENTYPRLSVRPRIRDVIEPITSDDDPTIIVVWETDGSPNHIRFSQRYNGDFADGTVIASSVHRPVVDINHSGLVTVAYYKTDGPNNIVNLSFKDIDSNVWTESNDISKGKAFGDGIYNIEIKSTGCDELYVTFKTGETIGPQRIVHLNNADTDRSLFSFTVYSEELKSPSDTRSSVAMHIDDKIANNILSSNAPSRISLAFTDYTTEFSEPDGIGNVHVFGGIIAQKPTIVTVTDEDGDNKPEFSWFVPGDQSDGFFDIYFRHCGASGIVPYEENIPLHGQFVSSADGFSMPGYLFTYEGLTEVNFADDRGWGIRKREGPWSDEYCFRLGDISVSHPKIIPPDNKLKVEKCDTVTLRGYAEPGSTIESQTLIEYSDVAGTIEINRTIISNYTIDSQGFYLGSMTLSLLPNTLSIRSEVIARDTDGNLSDPADSRSNLVVVQNEPPVLVEIKLVSQATCSETATNSETVNVVITATGEICDVKMWESVVSGGTGESGASWQPYHSTMTFTFANTTNETKTVFVKLKDCCGNESTIASDGIELDTVPPRILAATFDPATRRLTISFSEPVTSLDLSKIRIVKS